MAGQPTPAPTSRPRTRRIADELSLVELVDVLWRRKWILLGGILLGGLIGVGLTIVVPPLYTAETVLILEPRPMAEAEGDAAATVPDTAVVDSQTRVLASRSLAREVIAKLHLEDDEDLLRGSAAATAAARFLGRWTGHAAKTEPTAKGDEADIVTALLSRLTIKRDGKSHVITVDFTSTDPGTAAAVANCLVDLYLQGQLDRKYEATRRAAAWLREQVETTKTRLATGEDELARFRETAQAARGASLGVDEKELAELNRRLVVAMSERRGKETRLARLRQLIDAGGGGDGSGEWGSSALLQSLSAQRAEVIRREAELSRQLGDRHPRIQEVRAEAAQLDTRLRQERRAMLGQLEAEVAAARSEEDVLASSLDQMRSRAAAQDQASQRTAELERNIELNRRLYETYVTRLEGIADREQIQEPDARIISEAVQPTSPSFPQPKLILAMALTGGLLLGLAGMYFAETAEGGYRSARAVESELGLQVATLMPLVESATRDAVEPQDYPAERPRSRYAEALRDALAGVIVGRPPDRAPVILVTSTLPGEGKSTFSLSLARVAASDGLNVLLIDADLRRPTVGDLAGLPPGPGLVELLRGEFRLDEILQRDPKTEGLRLVLGSKRLAAPTRLFGGPGFANLLEAARTTFDLVVVDSAPVLAVADAKLLAGLADRVLFLIRYATTRRDLAAVAVRGLVDAGAPRLDAVLSQVDLRVHSRTAARDKGYAYAHLAQYYTE